MHIVALNFGKADFKGRLAMIPQHASLARKGKITLNLAGLMINLGSSPRGREPRSTKG